jgi:hypothetical protein
MNPTPIVYVKFSLIGIVIVAIFILAAMGKLDATAAVATAVGAVGALVVSLGISSAGTSAATAIEAHTRAMVASVDSSDMVKRGLGTGPQRGFASVGSMLIVIGVSAFGVCVLAAVVNLTACSGGISPQGATDIQVGLNATVCVIGNGATDLAAGMSPAQIVADLVAKCGVSVAQVSTIFDSMASASDKGVTPVQARALSAAAHSADAGN